MGAKAETAPAVRVRTDGGDDGGVTHDADKYRMNMRQIINLVEDFTRRPEANDQEFKRWFGNSKVVDHNGNPLIVYHGTRSHFAPEEFYPGSHFGDEEAANKRLDDTEDDAEDFPDMRQIDHHGAIIPVYLSIQHPLRLEDDGELSGPEPLIRAACETGVISKAEYAALYHQIQSFDPVTKRFSCLSEKDSYALIFNAFRKKGYDGIVYKNVVEGNAASWVPFSSDQIRSAFY